MELPPDVLDAGPLSTSSKSSQSRQSSVSLTFPSPSSGKTFSHGKKKIRKMTIPKVRSKQIPNKGLKNTHATAITKIAVLRPTMNDQMKAATAATPESSQPTKGIMSKSVIHGCQSI